MTRPAAPGRAFGIVIRRLFASLSLLSVVTAPAATAQEASWPFAVGEYLEYEVRVSRLGDVGTGRMWVEGPVTEGGVPTWRLRFEMEVGKGPIRASDRTSSWLDPRRFATVRFEKRERHPLSRSDERVTIDLATGRWSDAEGPSGALANESPLDELSFLYFLRTLPLDRDTTLRFDRHFDAGRNPTIVRVVGRDIVTTPAGIFRTRVIEMEVRDPKRYNGTGVIRLHVSEEECRMLIRIESRMPPFGTTTLTLSGWTHPPRYPAAVACGL